MFKKKSLCSILFGFGLMMSLGTFTAFASDVTDNKEYGFS
jgi:hypothetical protein